MPGFLEEMRLKAEKYEIKKEIISNSKIQIKGDEVEQIKEQKDKKNRKQKLELSTENLLDLKPDEINISDKNLKFTNEKNNEGDLVLLNKRKGELLTLSKSYKEIGKNIVRHDSNNPYLKDYSSKLSKIAIEILPILNEIAELSVMVDLIQKRETFEFMVEQGILEDTKYKIQKRIL